MTDFTPTEVEEAARAHFAALNPDKLDLKWERAGKRARNAARHAMRAALATLPSPELRAAPSAEEIGEEETSRLRLEALCGGPSETHDYAQNALAMLERLAIDPDLADWLEHFVVEKFEAFSKPTVAEK